MSGVEDVRAALEQVKDEINRARVCANTARRLVDEALAIIAGVESDHHERITPPQAGLVTADLDRTLESLSGSELAVDTVLSRL
ncbi:hypothetical protein [Actinoalloteichus hymeniacidonis]|uniref:Uncharacterized protein n=1 Tax=Actinoalloteichus hymeniacidonis TaxID=340345 RepID=A0AAC9N0N1_9PSEU|nr:hypothetical protein [Actinoalloteichus hymeniacidonis]AOS65789.1 hypothetical protein TL08_25055 [Actinoalloteichus hymeniacidonis]MBB5906120.1 DNA-binding transcriptional regulator/RsmH inhibitor MraZ [Actinoalloteichus hymeniacidonis]